MKKILSILEKQYEKIEEEIQKREGYVQERSEKWQESEKCEEYEYKTGDLDEVRDKLFDAIDGLKFYLNN